MKNYIKYYYELDVNDLILIDDKYLFKSGDNKYILKLYSNLDIQFYYRKLENLLSEYKFFSKIIPNVENKIITFINNKPYILLKIDLSLYNDKISIFDIRTDMLVNSSNWISNIKRFPWISLWENKIDYLEKWTIEKKDQYKRIYPILNFFLGVSENALLYLKEIIKKSKLNFDNILAIQHDRVDCDESLYDYYDPTSLVIDHPSRDISEYIKTMIMSGEFESDVFEKYLNTKTFSKFDIMLMYSRMIFPSFFYDSFEKFVLKKSSTIILDLEDKIKCFQTFLLQVSKILSSKYGIECPKWIFMID